MRRLLLAGGGGSVTLPATAHSLAVSGFWSNISDPVATYYNGTTYFAWVTDASDVKVASYNHAAGTVSTPVTLVNTAAPSGVIHNSPALLVRSSDHKILVTMTAEVGNIVYWLSTSAEDATAFGAQTSVAMGSFDYGTIVQLGSGDIYIFTIKLVSGTYKLAYVKSTDAGVTWGTPTVIIQPDSTTAMYFRVNTDGTWIDLFVTNTNRVDAASSVYHFRFDGTTLYQSDGTSIGTTFPYAASAGTLIQNAALGTARPEGSTYDGSNPVVVVFCYDSGAGYDLARVARWTGSAWSVNGIGNLGGLHTFKFNEGAAMLDANTVILPRLVGSYFEMFRVTTADSWSSYSETAITVSSGADNLEPFAAVNHATGFQALWGRGTLTSGSVFPLTIHRYGT